MGKFQNGKLGNVWRPHLKSLPLNCYMSQNKTFTRNPQRLEKLSCTNLKFDLKLVTLANNSFWHTWNLKLWTTWKISLAHTSNLNVETLNNSKNSFSHTFSNFNVETFNNLNNSFSHFKILKHLENLSFTHFELKNLKNTFPHLRTHNTLKKSLPHLALTWKSCKLLVCHHLEMNSHSLCKLKFRLSKGFSPFFYAIQVQNLSLLLILT
jgi:hypothetical protein